VFVLKASRILTHVKKLEDPEGSIALMEKGMARLGEKFGALLVQLPPFLHRHIELLDSFLGKVPPHRRVVVEFRHESWHVDDVFAALEEHNVGYCITHGAHLPCIPRITAPFVYVRFHGPDTDNLYAGSYTADDLALWADRMKGWANDGCDIYAYFNNDAYGNAVHNALTLAGMLGEPKIGDPLS